MIIEQRLTGRGLQLVDLKAEYRQTPSHAHFNSHYAVQNALYLAGTVPLRNGEPFPPGLVGRDLTLEQGPEAARQAMLLSLARIRYALGALDRVEQALQLTGFVNSAPGFTDQPGVINGAVDLLVELDGNRGIPTRAAIGCRGLSWNHSVELILTVVFTGPGVRPPLARDRSRARRPDRGDGAGMSGTTAGMRRPSGRLRPAVNTGVRRGVLPLVGRTAA
jgi:enamine deaminase RidA (YjgF/YER057c/UK114 family)